MHDQTKPIILPADEIIQPPELEHKIGIDTVDIDEDWEWTNDEEATFPEDIHPTDGDDETMD